MATAKQRRFCQALHEETGDLMRWATIMAVAKRLELDGRVAVLLAAECAAAGYVRLDVKGPPYALLPSSARLTEEGWKNVAAKIKGGVRGRKLMQDRQKRKRGSA
jgi:hypothetical protein